MLMHYYFNKKVARNPGCVFTFVKNQKNTMKKIFTMAAALFMMGSVCMAQDAAPAKQQPAKRNTVKTTHSPANANVAPNGNVRSNVVSNANANTQQSATAAPNQAAPNTNNKPAATQTK